MDRRRKKNISSHISAEYGFFVSRIAPLKKGVINENFRVSTDRGECLFKIYNLKRPEEIGFEVEALQELARHDFPSPRLLVNLKGEILGVYEDKPCLAYEFIEGEPVEAWNTNIIQQVGALMGRMHAVLKDFSNRARAFTWDHNEIPRLVRDEGYKMVEAGFPEARQLLVTLEERLEDVKLPAGLPTGFTHQDIKPENVLVKKGRVTGIVDFDNSYYGAFMHDMTTSIIWSCYKNERLDQSLMESFLQGYETERPLTAAEREHFENGLKFRLLREAFISPFAALPHNMDVTKQRSDYFLRLV